MTNKTICYRREEYVVPTWARFIATDFNGDIFVYDFKPIFLGKTWANDGCSECVGHRAPVRAPGNTLGEIRPVNLVQKLPRYKLTPVNEVCVGDTITVRVNWHISGWCPAIVVNDIDRCDFIGTDIDKKCRAISRLNKSHVWKRVP